MAWSTEYVRASGLRLRVGFSFGGAISQELARMAPERVRRLVLCATGPGLGGTPPGPLAAMALASPARYYDPLAFRIATPLLAGGKTARNPMALQARGSAARPISSATPTSCTRRRAGRACRGCPVCRSGRS